MIVVVGVLVDRWRWALMREVRFFLLLVGAKRWLLLLHRALINEDVCGLYE